MPPPPKRSFTSFVQRVPVSAVGNDSPHGQLQANFKSSSENTSAGQLDHEANSAVSVPTSTTTRQLLQSRGGQNRGGEGGASPDRTKIITSTGRVRTYTASRNLPGVTLRLTEDRWERLKLLSIQERRPIQEILGEAVDAYMRTRGLQW